VHAYLGEPSIVLAMEAQLERARRTLTVVLDTTVPERKAQCDETVGAVADNIAVETLRYETKVDGNPHK